MKAFVVAVGMTVLGLAGCQEPHGAAATNSAEAMETGQFAVDNEKELPACDDTKEGYLAYIRDEQRVMQCNKSEWAAEAVIN
jgi:hypothetical protein